MLLPLLRGGDMLLLTNCSTFQSAEEKCIQLLGKQRCLYCFSSDNSFLLARVAALAGEGLNFAEICWNEIPLSRLVQADVTFSSTTFHDPEAIFLLLSPTANVTTITGMLSYVRVYCKICVYRLHAVMFSLIMRNGPE